MYLILLIVKRNLIFHIIYVAFSNKTKMDSVVQKYMARKTLHVKMQLVGENQTSPLRNELMFFPNQDQTHNLIIDSSYNQVFQIPF